jgi:hypothetical protein
MLSPGAKGVRTYCRRLISDIPKKASRVKGASVGVKVRTQANRRRTKRILLTLADEMIFVQFLGPNKEIVQEQASAMVVNAHGGLVRLRARVSSGQDLTILNMRKSRNATSRIVWTRALDDQQNLVAFEFNLPAPAIWPVVSWPLDRNRSL